MRVKERDDTVSTMTSLALVIAFQCNLTYKFLSTLLHIVLLSVFCSHYSALRITCRLIISSSKYLNNSSFFFPSRTPFSLQWYLIFVTDPSLLFCGKPSLGFSSLVKLLDFRFKTSIYIPGEFYIYNVFRENKKKRNSKRTYIFFPFQKCRFLLPSEAGTIRGFPGKHFPIIFSV